MSPNALEYALKLSELQPSTYPSPKRCGSLYHCEERPICHTDFKPHYGPPEMTLSGIVVGETTWDYDPGQGTAVCMVGMTQY